MNEEEEVLSMNEEEGSMYEEEVVLTVMERVVSTTWYGRQLLLSVDIDMKSFFVSVVYGSNQVSSRRQLWIDLRSCFGLVGSNPWILVGDFNTVRRQNEKSDPSHFHASAASDFNSCLEDIEMEDLNSKGLWFTWSNKRTGHNHCSSRLDKKLRRLKPCLRSFNKEFYGDISNEEQNFINLQ
ncbi:hypothetical protein RHMOL_Rhmol05G0020800 [Rhododendron molle]|uniref:Uncharacterized protein n=1 Tax=Rhododendron molle TaxID=49168 RepID=A0ACC0NL67_RHOML|nr:hypothetical protein RHMOL_Rhmol05G0020800 [Rhododendron molle]